MPKAYDLVVITGSYKNSAGEEKKQYKNIGIVNQTDKGMYILLDRTFNPAGVPNPENKDMVMVSMFEPKEKQDKPKNNDIQSPSFGDDLDDEFFS